MKSMRFRKLIVGLIIASVAIPWGIVTPNIKVKAAEPGTSPEQVVNTTPIVLPPKEGKIELPDQQTAYSTTYLKSDGSKEMVVSSVPVHYQTQENNQTVWKDINTSLEALPSLSNFQGAAGYHNKANKFELQFSKNLSIQGFDISKNQTTISISASDLTGSKIAGNQSSPATLNALNTLLPQPLVDGNGITYPDIAPDTNITYRSIAEGVKEEIVLNRWNDQNSFSFELKLKNLYFEKQADGTFIFYNQTTKQPEFYLPKSYMTDALRNDDFPEGALSYDVNTEIIEQPAGFQIRLTPDKAWLAAPERVYPVTIDPTIVTDLDYGEDSFVQQGYPNTNSWDQAQLYIGRTSYYGKGITRTFIPFFLPDLKNARISNANFSAYQYICNGICPSSGVNVRLTGDYAPKAITWNNPPWISSDWVGHMSDGGVNKWINIDVTTAAKYWFEAGNPGNTKVGSLGFLQDDEYNYGQRNWKAENGNPGYSPTLTINYNDYDASYGIDRPAGDIRVDDVIDVTARLRNDGRNTWHVSDTKLGYHIYDPNGGTVVWDGLQTALPRDVGPGGDYVEFTAKLKMPSSLGDYIVKWDLIQPGVTWFSSQGVPTFDYTIHANDYPDYEVQYEPISVPSSVVAGSTMHISLNVFNTGKLTWTTSQYSAGSHWYDNEAKEYSIWNGTPNVLPKDVPARNGQATLDMLVRVPANAGNYKLKIDMFRSGVGYFSEKGVATKDYDLIVTPPNVSSLNHLGSEEFYVKAGPVDLATGNLTFSSTESTVPSNSGLLSFSRTYNSMTLDQFYNHDSQGFIKNWLFNGPYRNNDLTTLLSSNYVVNEATVRPNTLAVSSNKVWAKSVASSNIVDIRQILESNWQLQSKYALNSAVYAHSYVYSPSARTAQLRIGSDDGVKVWLNGSVKETKNSFRPFKLDNDILNVSLIAGWNSLLVKVSQRDSGWLMSARFTDTFGNPIANLKYALDNQDIYGDFQLMGKGWSTSLSEKLYISDSENIYYRYLDGSVNLFTRNSNGTYKRPSGIFLNLVKNSDLSYTITNKDGLKTNFNSSGKLINKTDLSGNSVVYQYDTSGKCIKMADTNRYLSFAYSGNKLISATDQLGNKYSYTYDSLGKLIKVTDPASNPHNYTYDGLNRLAQYLDKKGAISKIIYGADGKISTLTNPLNAGYKFSYSAGKTEMTDPLGRKNILEFDGNNLLTAFTNAKKYREIIAYDGDYNVVSVTPDLPENNYYYYRYAYTYDSNSNLVEISNILGQKTKFQFSVNNDLIKETQPDGTFFQYFQSTDGRRLLIKQIDPKGNIYDYTYDSRGRVITSKDPVGNVTKYSYSADGDTASITTPKGEITTSTFDTIGRKVTDKSPLGKTLTYAYSLTSLLTKITDPLGQNTLYVYDKSGNKTKETYPNGTNKQYVYDSIGQLTKTIDESGATVQYFYDLVGNKIKVIDAAGKITIYTYDELDQLISEKDATGGLTSAVYDRNGQPVKVTDPKGQVTTSIYDKIGGLTKVTDGEGTTSLTYDSKGNTTKVVSTKNSETMQMVYDANSNLTSLASNLTGTTTATYDKNNRVVSTATPTTKTTRSYDPNGAIASMAVVVNSITQTTQYSRDAEGKTTNIIKPNGDSTAYTYDAANRVASVVSKNKTGQMVSGFNYLYNKGLNVLSSTDIKNNITNTYAYDARNQLTKENAKTYAYDSMGNRTSAISGTSTTSYQYQTTGDTNKLLKVSYPATGMMPAQIGPGGQPAKTVSYEYDANGNIIKQTDSFLGVTTYTYDTDGYFTKATLPNGSSVEYQYNKVQKLRTKRIEKSPTGVVKTSVFTYEGNRLVSEAIGGTSQVYTYISDDNDNPIAVMMKTPLGTQVTLDYVRNAKNDVIGLADPAGNLVIEYQYDAWGNIVKTTKSVNTMFSDPASLNPRLFSGYWYDSALGLYFMKARMYDSKIGRFLAKDPAPRNQTALDYNPYIYCYNNPLVYIDSDGKFAELAIAGAGLIGGGIAAGATFPLWGTILVGVAIGVVVGYAITQVIDYASTDTISESVPDSTSISQTSSNTSPTSSSPPNNNKNKGKNTKPRKTFESPNKPDPTKYKDLDIGNKISKFFKKASPGSKDFTIDRLGDGLIKATYTTPAFVGDRARAVYVKVIDLAGRTMTVYKETYTRQGDLWDTKIKFLAE